MFDWKKPTVQMLGRWQPWHDGHTELFKTALKKTGQVCIMYRDVEGVDAGVEGQTDNPFGFEEVKKNIIVGLSKHNFEEGRDYVVIKVPNIINISYGRGVGYSFTEHDLGKRDTCHICYQYKKRIEIEKRVIINILLKDCSAKDFDFIIFNTKYQAT